MKTYEFQVVTRVIKIRAASEDEAETLYDAFYDEEIGEDDPRIIEYSDDVYHITTEVEEERDAD
jgi:hypothetical protein